MFGLEQRSSVFTSTSIFWQKRITKSFSVCVTRSLVLPPFTKMVLLSFSWIFGSFFSNSRLARCVFGFLEEKGFAYELTEDPVRPVHQRKLLSKKTLLYTFRLQWKYAQTQLLCKEMCKSNKYAKSMQRPHHHVISSRRQAGGGGVSRLSAGQQIVTGLHSNDIKVPPFSASQSWTDPMVKGNSCFDKLIFSLTAHTSTLITQHPYTSLLKYYC